MSVSPYQGSGSDSSAEQIDHSSDPRFFEYYERQSASPAAMARSRSVLHKVMKLLDCETAASRPLHVLDIGCGAGTQCRLWAELGHTVYGLDVNRPLIELARQRASEAGLVIQFDVGTATRLPYRDSQMDVCLAPELLEHVPDWESCLNEASRVLGSTCARR